MEATLLRKRLHDPRSKKKTNMPSANRLRTALTLIMGCFIPLFSLALSNVAGTLATTHVALSGLSFILMACTLAVSLSHLQWAIKDITRSHSWAAWLLAIAFDMALVLGELTHILTDQSDIVTTAIMVAVCGLSMFLNCWAFFKSPQAEAKAKKRACNKLTNR